MLSNDIFNRISQSADFIASNNLKRKLAAENAQTELEKQAMHENTLKEIADKKNRQSFLSMIAKKTLDTGLDPENQQKLLAELWKNPEYQPTPDILQPQSIDTGTPIGQLPVKRLSDLTEYYQAQKGKQAVETEKGRTARQESLQGLDQARIDKLKKDVVRGAKGSTGTELSKAIDDTRFRMKELEKIDVAERTTKQSKELRDLSSRHNELIKMQNKQVGLQKKEIKSRVASLKTLPTLVKQGLMDENTYKQNIKKIFNELGGTEEAFRMINKALGLK